MAETRDPDLPAPPDARDRPQIGVDEWVATHEGRREHGVLVRGREAVERVPDPLKVLAILAVGAVIPLFVSSDYIMQVALDTLVFMLLAMGLNVAVGFGGLLDLGYVAFFGFGAYGYAFLASDHFDLHWQAQFVLPVVVVATAILGILLGLPSRRLVGDYLAIVTLFFLQLFLTIVINIDRIDLQWLEDPIEQTITRGPNGISDLDPLNFFGWTAETLDELYYVLLVTFGVVMLLLFFVNRSRIGRAWRSLREDPLAAELMSMPVNRLKLMAFSFGAAIAGLTGALFAAEQSSVFPANFDLTLLITLYAMVILGGVGSVTGVALGAVVINASLEALRSPENASTLFFLALVLVVLLVVRPWWLGAGVLAATVVFGVIVHAVADAVWERGVSGESVGGARIDDLVEGWVLIPSNPGDLAKVAYLGLVAAVLGLTLLRGWWRTIALVPTLYLAACVWEFVMLPQPAVARYLLIGAMLVGLMAVRPQGLLGTTRVEIV